MLEPLTEPLAQPFFLRACAEIALIGLAAGPVGCWVILYGVAYGAESMSHSLLPGLVLAALAGAPLLLGAAPGIVLAALAIALIGCAPGIDRDTAIGIAVTGLFGLGALMALAAETPPGLGELLFGDILATTGADLAVAAGLAAAVTAALVVLHPRLLASGFDPGAAGGLGLRAGIAELLVLALLALTVLIAVQGLGNLLVVAILVGPAAAARLLSDRLVPMMAIAAGLAVAVGLVGLYVSYYAGTAAGASIALAAVLAYVVCALLPRGLRRRGAIGAGESGALATINR